MANVTRFSSQCLICTNMAGPACSNKYDYFTYQPLADIVNDPGYFRAAWNMLRAGTEVRICRMTLQEGPPTEAGELAESLETTVIRSEPQAVHLLIGAHHDAAVAEQAVQHTGEQKVRGKLRWNPGRGTYDLMIGGNVAARFEKEQKELADKVAAGEVPIPATAAA